MSLDGFPRSTLRGDQTLYRIHHASRGGWWFSADGSGRFDPVGSDLGACYLAAQPLGAWVEVFRKTMLVAEPDVTRRSLLSVATGRRLRLADLTSRRALRFGVTASLGADREHRPSQTFALEALRAGFDGIRYWVRHDPAQRLYGIALFGPAGAPDPSDPAWPAGRSGPIPDALLEHARDAFGYDVIPVP